ncbi:MAG: holo-ACP synthase [Elusimicrobiota bacterium]|jgi:holo-[acyl-carrier protein] synthase|nr:holo-ACP synthase [Elusimicrobiota bacterium]
MNIGIDIEEIDRFKKYAKDRVFLEKVFSKEELKYSLSKKTAIQHLAARFAAKEAVWKALNRKDKKLLIKDISIKNAKDSKPEIYIRNKKYKRIDISISHTKQYAAAAAIVF